jgi:hypothetical protein
MKISRIVCLSIAIVIPQLATAKVPMPAESFGQIESVLDFCSQVNPKLASNYKDFKKMLAGDATDKELADARDQQEYKDSYQSANEKLTKLEPEKAVKTCSSLLQPGK